jgi:ATP-dependent DNA helicase MPH1
MFHTSLTEFASNTTPSGKKAGTKGSSAHIRNNIEFQRLLRDVEAEMNLIRIGAGGRGKGNGHPKMTQTLDLVSALADHRTHERAG